MVSRNVHHLRNNLIKYLIFILLISGYNFSFAQHKLMPLGNSITLGIGSGTPYTGYRKVLYNLLINNGMNYDFVGSQQDGNSSQFDIDHEGHAGWTAQQIDANINSWLQDSSPIIVLLHIGTNDISGWESNQNNINEIESIVDKTYNYDSNTVILLCSIIPRLDCENEKCTKTEELNVLIQQLINQKYNQGYNIYHVDQYAAFTSNVNWQTEYMSDNMHPNNDGYYVMAVTFFDVLKNINIPIPEFTLTININPTDAGHVEVDPDKEKYESNESVRIEAIPNENYRFDHWDGVGGDNTANPITITMKHDREITANFVNDAIEIVSVPNTPTGPSSGDIGLNLTFNTGESTSSLGNEVEYQFDWGDETQSSWGGTSRSHSYNSSGIYQVKARARSKPNNSVMSNWSDSHQVNIADAEYVIEPIKPEGPTNGYTEQILTFNTGGSTSNQGNEVEYQFDWGDGNQSSWGGTSRSHSYNSSGTYQVKAHARSKPNPDVLSNWSDAHTVNISGYTLSITTDPASVGSVSKNPDKAEYDKNESVQLTANSDYNSTNSVYIEAESGSLYGPVTIGYSSEASGGQYVYGTSSQPKAANIEYNFDIQESGTYVIWGRCYALSGVEDSFFIVVDESSDTLTWHLTTEYYNWQWQKVSDWYVVQEFSFSKGTHSLSVVTRDINSRLDKIIITKDQSFQPEGKGEDPSSKIYCFDHWSGDLTGSNNPTTIVMNSDKNVTAHFVETNEVVLTPTTPGGPSAGFIEQSLTFSTGGAVSDLGHEVEYQFDWGNGNQSNWGSSTQSYTYTSIGTFQVRARARCKIHTHIVSNWSNSHNVTISEVTLNTLTVEISPRGSGSVSRDPYKAGYEQNEWLQLYARLYCPDNNIRIEAESGELSGPVTIGNDTEASGSEYIYGTTVEPQVGSAEYTFDIREADTYVIWGRCYALSGGEDSFFIQVDEGVDILTWHLDNDYYQWKWQKISDMHQVQEFLFNVGQHTLKVIKRDINARLDKIIITKDMSFQPSGKEEGGTSPDVCYRFDHWGGDLSGNTNPVDILMNNNKTVIAYFIEADEVVSPPTTPVGPDSGVTGQTLTFITGGAYSSKGNNVEYQFDWGDGSLSNWGSSSNYHIYTSSNNYEIKARARSQVDTMAVSNWSGGHSITISGITLSISIYPQETGTVTKNPDQTYYSYGDTITLMPLAEEGYLFDHWSGDLTGDDNPIKIAMNNNKTVTAIFAEAPEVVLKPTTISGPSSGIMGQALTFETGGAVSNLGNEIQYQFDWGDGIFSEWEQSTNEHMYYLTGTMEVKSRARSKIHQNVISDWSNVHIVVISGYSLTIVVDPDSVGYVFKNPDKPKYASEWNVELSATGISGYAFDHWEGDLTGDANPKTIIMNSDKQVMAYFSKTEETVYAPTFISGPDSGVVGQTLSFSTGEAKDNFGYTVEYRFDWGDGTLSDWGDSTREHSYNTIGVKDVKSMARSKTNTSVVSQWTEAHSLVIYSVNYTITISIEPAGTGNVNRTPLKSEYEDGDTVILSPIPITGYMFDSWSGDLIGIDNPKILIIYESKNITANFKQISDVVNEKPDLPNKFTLSQNFPNPFNPETTIQYQLAKNCNVKIIIYNVHGQIIKILIDESQSAGYYDANWNGVDSRRNKVPSGIYLYQLETEYFTQIKKMILIK